MTKEITYVTIIFVTLATLLIGFSLVVALDSCTSVKRKKIFFAIIAFTFILVLQNLTSHYLTYYTVAVILRTLVSIVGYSVRPVIITLFAFLLAPKKKHIIAWILVGFNFVMHTTSFYSNIVFSISEENRYYGGSLKYLCLAVCFLLLVYLAVLAFVSYNERKIGIKEIVFHGFWMLIILLGIIADILWGFDYIWISYVTISVVIAGICSYIWLHQRFVEDYESAVLAKQRFNIMLSQIQPHFIYNSLSAIAEIDGVPEKAQNAIVDFSNYLRENFDALNMLYKNGIFEE